VAAKFLGGLDLAAPPEASGGQALAFCRHCGKDTFSATQMLEVGGTKYEVSYCDNCGIASGAFRMSRDGRSREGPADNLVLRRLRRPEKK
jgi:hypothetical protein